MGGDHQVVVLDHQVRHLHHRQVQRQSLPPSAVVEGDVDGALRSRVEQPGARRVLAGRANEIVGGETADDTRPRLAVVVRPPYVGTAVVVHEIPYPGHVCLPRRGGRRLDRVDAHEIGSVRGGDVVPVEASVPGDVDEPVVGAGPDHIGVVVRGRDREDGGVRLNPRLVLGDRAARRTDRHGVGPGEVGAELLPALPFSSGLPDLLRPRVEHLGVVVGEHDGEGPLHPFDKVLRRLPHGVLGPDVDGPARPRAHVEP